MDTGAAAGATDTSNTQFHTDVEVTFSMSGETDNGLSFGGSVQLDEAGAADPADDGGSAFFVSGAFGTLTVGDTDGALDFAMTEILGPGSLGDQESSHDGFKGSYLDGSYDGQIARFDYTAGDVSFAVSTEIADTDRAGRGNGYAFGAKYTMGNITFGAGYQKADTVGNVTFGGTAAVAAVAGTTGSYIDDTDNSRVITSGAVTDGVEGFVAADDTILAPGADAVTAVAGGIAEVDATGLSVSGTFGAVTAGLAYTMYDSNIALHDATHTSVGISYTQGAMTIGANYGDFDSDDNDQDRDGMGITANYSLGGGATLQAGYETSDGGAPSADRGDSWSLGLAMSF